MITSPPMLRDFRRASRTMRRLATLVAVPLVAAAIAGCGIKGPLKQPDATPATAPSATTPSPTVSPSTGVAGTSTPRSR